MKLNSDDEQELTPEEYRLYTRLHMWTVILDNLFCTAFVLCITLLAYTTGNWKLMWFYLMPVVAYMAV